MQKSVIIVGAGPAGLEAARVTAERGHRVTLLEKERRIGGQFRLAASQPQRGEIAQLINGYYQAELVRLGVELKLECKVDARVLASLEPDVVIIATGSVPTMTEHQRRLPMLREVPGVGLANVFSVNQVLTERPALGERVILLDDIEGWMPAAGTVAYLGSQGKDVTVLTSSASPMQSLVNSTANGPMRLMWSDFGVTVQPSTVLLEWTGEQARIRNLIDGKESLVDGDALVLATTNRPDPLRFGREDQGYDIHFIGDCVAARTATAGFYEGRKLGQQL